MKIREELTAPSQSRHDFGASVDREGGGFESPTQGGGLGAGPAGKDTAG